eukprot:3363448-Pyramimonas_sp.AAC.1
MVVEPLTPFATGARVRARTLAPPRASPLAVPATCCRPAPTPHTIHIRRHTHTAHLLATRWRAENARTRRPLGVGTHCITRRP